jgi:scyllo-inositol 2-dehydrogenase (NADP+)
MADRRIAIIGYGLAGRTFHAPLIVATPGLAIAAIVTADPERRARAGLENPDAVVVPAAEQLWEHASELDAVVIAAPNAAHVPLATTAIDHRLAAVVDKPLAITAAEAEALVDHAEQAGTLLTVFHNRRWDSDQLVLDQAIAEGALGSVIRYESRFERWRPEPRPDSWRERSAPADGGGLLLDLGSHLVDQALHRFGPVQTVYAEIAARRGTPADDDVFIALSHRCGVISHLHASALTAAPGPRLRVLGDEGALIATALDTQEDRLRAGERPDTVEDWGVEPQYARPRLIVGERSVPLSGPRGDWGAFYRGLRDALSGDGPVPVDPHDAVAGLRVLEAARASAAESRIVEL